MKLLSFDFSNLEKFGSSLNIICPKYEVHLLLKEWTFQFPRKGLSYFGGWTEKGMRKRNILFFQFPWKVFVIVFLHYYLYYAKWMSKIHERQIHWNKLRHEPGVWCNTHDHDFWSQGKCLCLICHWSLTANAVLPPATPSPEAAASCKPDSHPDAIQVKHQYSKDPVQGGHVQLGEF